MSNPVEAFIEDQLAIDGISAELTAANELIRTAELMRSGLQGRMKSSGDSAISNFMQALSEAPELYRGLMMLQLQGNEGIIDRTQQYGNDRWAKLREAGSYASKFVDLSELLEGSEKTSPFVSLDIHLHQVNLKSSKQASKATQQAEAVTSIEARVGEIPPLTGFSYTEKKAMTLEDGTFRETKTPISVGITVGSVVSVRSVTSGFEDARWFDEPEVRIEDLRTLPVFFGSVRPKHKIIRVSDVTKGMFDIADERAQSNSMLFIGRTAVHTVGEILDQYSESIDHKARSALAEQIDEVIV